VNLRFAKWEALISLVSGHDAKPTHLETPDEMDRNQSSLVLRDNRAVTPQNQPSPSAAELSAVVALKGRIIDVQKHMTMLSAGSVVGVATFLDKAFTRPGMEAVSGRLSRVLLREHYFNIVDDLAYACFLFWQFRQDVCR
jgi:hypothetical protein